MHALSVAGTLRTAGDAWRRLQRLVRVGDMLNEVEAVAAAFARDEVGAVLGALHRALTTSNPGGEPRNAEAVRRLIFFCALDAQPADEAAAAAPRHEAADVVHAALRRGRARTSIAALNGAAKAGDGHAAPPAALATTPDEWEHIARRLCVQSSAAVEGSPSEEQRHVMRWASDRAQVLSPTVRGVMHYGGAACAARAPRGARRGRARAGGALEVRVRRHVPDLRAAARLEEEDDKWKAAGIDELRRRYAANLRVAYVEGDPKKPAEGFNSLLLGIDGPVGAQKDVVLCKIALPGNPILGEGSPRTRTTRSCSRAASTCRRST